jgi:hypothetical protein
MPSKDRKRYDKELNEARAGTQESIRRNRALSDRYGQGLATAEGRMGGALDRFSQFDPQLQEYSQFGQAPVTGLEGGLSPEALAAMKGAAIDQVPGRFDAAARAIKLRQLRRGGGGAAPAGGDYSRDLGGLYAAREQERAGALRGVTMEDEKMRRENILANRQQQLAQRGVGLQAMGLGANINQGYANTISDQAGRYIGGQTSLAGTEAGLGQTLGQQIRPEDTRPGFWKQLGGAALGAGMGFLTGGFTNPFKKKPSGGGFDPAFPN